jgi:hypothetical protein
MLSQSAEKQRLEELALKQSRQLIPMKPSLPKNMVSSSYLLQWAVLSQSSMYPDVGGCHSFSSFVESFTFEDLSVYIYCSTPCKAGVFKVPSVSDMNYILCFCWLSIFTSFRLLLIVIVSLSHCFF